MPNYIWDAVLKVDPFRLTYEHHVLRECGQGDAKALNLTDT